MRRRPLLIACAIGVLVATAAAREHIVDRWSVEEGLPNNALTDIVQTRDGYLWIATWAGVVRFDGVRFTPIAEDLPNAHALALLEGADRTMWVGTSGGGLVRWRDDGFETFTPANGLAGYEVRALAQDADGRIWAATENGVSVLEHGRLSTVRTAQGLRDNDVKAVKRGREGQIWIATATGICEAHSTQVSCQAPRFVRGTPSAILEGRSGHLWVGTDKGLFAEGVERPRGSLCALPACVLDGSITALHESKDGGVWVGFGNGGVALVRGPTMERYGTGDGLPAGTVVAFHEDPEGGVWVATYNGGLSRLKRTRVTMYSTADGLPAPTVGSIVQDATGTIFAGAQCGPVSELRGGRFVPRFAEHTRDACAWVLLPARDGSLWIGTRGSGLFRWTGRDMEHFGRENGLSDAYVCGLFEDRDGTIWIGTELGGLHTYAGGRLSRAFGAADGVATHHLASFAQDRTGRLWIGSNGNGLSVYEGGRFRRLTGEEGPPIQNIAGLLVDSRGDLWIGSAAHGLFRWRNGRYEPFGVAQGLGDRLVAVLIEDRDSNLWVSTARGISRLERARIEAVADGQAATLDPIIIDRTDGLRNPEGSGGGFDPSGLRDRDGRLWFSTIDGIAMIDPASFTVNRIVPKVLVEAVTLAGRPAAVRPDQPIEVPAGTASIDLAYTAFSFAAPGKVRFRYRLAGFDDAWQDVGARRTAYYSRLPPGDYTFEVVAANNDGTWNPVPATARLVVMPFLWERADVRSAALTALLAVTGLLFYAVAQRQARRRLGDLERERAIERERTRIARDLHDDLGARLVQIALIAEDENASRPRERISGVARETMQTMDELVWTVNARNDTVESFAEYAAEFVEEHLGAAGLRYRLHFEPDLEGRLLTADSRRHLFLAFKEAVHNVVKHAGATEVHVSLAIEGSTLRVEVADNGRGFPLPIAEGSDAVVTGDFGNGLRNMRERMEAIKGELRVSSAPGQGARLTFRVPL